MFKPDLLRSIFKLSLSNVPYYCASNASLVWGSSLPLMHHWCGYLYSDFYSNTQCLSVSFFKLLFIKSSFNVLCLFKCANHIATHHPIFSFLLKSYFVHLITNPTTPTLIKPTTTRKKKKKKQTWAKPTAKMVYYAIFSFEPKKKKKNHELEK